MLTEITRKPSAYILSRTLRTLPKQSTTFEVIHVLKDVGVVDRLRVVSDVCRESRLTCINHHCNNNHILELAAENIVDGAVVKAIVQGHSRAMLLH